MMKMPGLLGTGHGGQGDRGQGENGDEDRGKAIVMGVRAR